VVEPQTTNTEDTQAAPTPAVISEPTPAVTSEETVGIMRDKGATEETTAIENDLDSSAEDVIMLEPVSPSITTTGLLSLPLWILCNDLCELIAKGSPLPVDRSSTGDKGKEQVQASPGNDKVKTPVTCTLNVYITFVST